MCNPPIFFLTFRVIFCWMKLRQSRAVCDYFVSNRCCFVDCVSHNLESFVVSLMIERVTNPKKVCVGGYLMTIHKIHTKRQKKNLHLFGGVGGRGYTFHWQPYWRGYTYHWWCLWGYTYHCDTKICDISVHISLFPASLLCEERIHCCLVILLSLIKIWKASVEILHSLVLTSLSRRQSVELVSVNLFVKSSLYLVFKL